MIINKIINIDQDTKKGATRDVGEQGVVSIGVLKTVLSEIRR